MQELMYYQREVVSSNRVLNAVHCYVKSYFLLQLHLLVCVGEVKLCELLPP